ncbi:MAG TPA: hypothetical protein VG900_15455 [Hyphomicrobiaceae bacterium]|nr:hypothetical protein [Hyphomicrobiaceae bacterium]
MDRVRCSAQVPSLGRRQILIRQSPGYRRFFFAAFLTGRFTAFFFAAFFFALAIFIPLSFRPNQFGTLEY